MRQVVLAPLQHVFEHIRRSDPNAVITTKRAYDWLKGATPESLKAYAAFVGSSPTALPRYASVGPADVLWTPPGWFFYEKIGSSSDVAGARCPVLLSSDMQVLEGVARYFTSIEKPNQTLSKVVDALAML